MNVLSGNRLERLADALFRNLRRSSVSDPAAVLARRDGVVVPSRILQVWLQQRFLFHPEPADAPRVLTACDFPLLNVFVNDWLYRMDHPGTAFRDPIVHPFSVESLSWRIYRFFDQQREADLPEMEPLRAFLRDADGARGPRALRRFQLARRLAAVFDGYAVYRPEMLTAWEQGRAGDLPASVSWEPALWRELTADGLREQTYVAAFRRMEKKLARCGIGRMYAQLHVFCPAILPRAYQVFFQTLSATLPVYLYLFNPSSTDWIVRDRPDRAARAQEQIRLEAEDEAPGLFDRDNPLLAGLGRGIHEYLAELLDVTEGDLGIEEDTAPPPVPTAALPVLQRALADDVPMPPPDPAAPDPADPDLAQRAGLPATAFSSLQIHVCHSPRREVEVLRDHVLGWLSARSLPPREIQVQVSDMARYAPYIEAVFSTPRKDAPEAIPFAIADRVRVGESDVADGFIRLLHLADSRFTAPETLELLQCDSLRLAFDLSPAELDTIYAWVAAAGIRWGRNETHRKRETEVEFTAATTWQYGLDRLLKGYALGRHGAAQDEAPPLPCDGVEGDDAETLGKLARFIDALGEVAETFRRPHRVDDWVDTLGHVIDEFFRSDNDTFLDVSLLRQAVETLQKSAAAADGTGLVVDIDVIRESLRTHLQGALGGSGLTGNAVVFSALRPGSSAPRSVMCLLGMGDGLFPRQENRPAYDLLRIRRKRGDRTPRIDARTAFLEALLSARDALYVSYTGYSLEDGSDIPSSVLVRELMEAVGKERCVVVSHKLQAFHPDYFFGPSPRFSYSSENRQAAQQGFGPKPDPAGNEEFGAPPVARAAAEPPAAAAAPPIEVSELIAFFKQPAEYYTRHILGIRLDRRSHALAESEEFAPEARDAYRVRERMVEAMVRYRADEGDRDRWRRRLEDDGLVPLAYWGRAWFDRYWDEVRALLDTEIQDDSRTIRDALIRQSEWDGEQECRIPTGATMLTGWVRDPVPGPTPRRFDFRPAQPNVSQTLAAFLYHLFACAAGQGATLFYLRRKDATRVECARFEPIAEESARAILEPYVERFRAGLISLPPFAPESAWAFLAKSRTASREEAMDAARNAWYSSAHHRGEEEDLYARNAFGPEGPMLDPAFEETARAFLLPLLEGKGT